MIFRTFSAPFKSLLLTRGDALRSAQRLPLAIIFRALGAAPPIGFRFRGKPKPTNTFESEALSSVWDATRPWRMSFLSRH